MTMAQTNPFNVFRGPDSVMHYYDPDLQPPLPLVELPNTLNPFRGDGVRIYAKMMNSLPAHNIKALPGKGPTPKLAWSSSRLIFIPSS